MAEAIGRKTMGKEAIGRAGFGKKLKLRPSNRETFTEVLDRILDKGVVIDARIRTYLVNVKLIGIRAKVLLASFESGAMHGLKFPDGINYDTQAWRDLIEKEACPQCNKRVEIKELRRGCPWCGFKLGQVG
ncbi:MAG: gas vesicle protein GvpJ [Nanoarchaeota archaeon]